MSLQNEMFDLKVTEINEACPIIIDEWTRLDKLVLESGLRAVYYHTITELDAKSVNPEMVIIVLKEQKVHEFKSDSDTMKFIYNGFTFVFVYSSPEGEEIVRFDISAEDCKVDRVYH